MEIEANKTAAPVALTDESILQLAEESERTHAQGKWKEQMIHFARAIEREVLGRPTATSSVSAIDLTRLQEPLSAFGDWLNEPPSRGYEPTEVRNYRYEAYRRWQAALNAVRAALAKAAPAVTVAAQPQAAGRDNPQYLEISIVKLNNGDRWDATITGRYPIHVSHAGPHDALRMALEHAGEQAAQPQEPTPALEFKEDDCRQSWENTFHKVRAEISYDDWKRVWQKAVEWLNYDLAQAAPAVPDEREAFEKWYAETWGKHWGKDDREQFARRDDGSEDYLYDGIQRYWEGWMARAMIAVATSAPSVSADAQAEEIRRIWAAMPAHLNNEPFVKNLYHAALAKATGSAA